MRETWLLAVACAMATGCQTGCDGPACPLPQDRGILRGDVPSLLEAGLSAGRRRDAQVVAECILALGVRTDDTTAAYHALWELQRRSDWAGLRLPRGIDWPEKLPSDRPPIPASWRVEGLGSRNIDLEVFAFEGGIRLNLVSNTTASAPREHRKAARYPVKPSGGDDTQIGLDLLEDAIHRKDLDMVAWAVIYLSLRAPYEKRVVKGISRAIAFAEQVEMTKVSVGVEWPDTVEGLVTYKHYLWQVKDALRSHEGDIRNYCQDAYFRIAARKPE